MLVIKPREIDSDFLFAKQLVNDYISWLDIDLSFQDIDNELSDLSSMYVLRTDFFYSSGTKMGLRVS